MKLTFTIDEDDFKEALSKNSIEDTKENRGKVICELEWIFIDGLKKNVMRVANNHSHALGIKKD